jgi:hypothetical protein
MPVARGSSSDALHALCSSELPNWKLVRRCELQFLQTGAELAGVARDRERDPHVHEADPPLARFVEKRPNERSSTQQRTKETPMTAENFGIARLMYVCEMKRQNANESALNGADKQRDLVAKQKVVREAQRKLEELAADKKLDSTDQGKMQNVFNGLGTSGIQGVSYNYNLQGDGSTGDVSNAQQKANADEVDRMRKDLEAVQKDLEAQDKMGAYEIQDLMSQYNQSESLLNSVRGKLDKTIEGGISKIA